MSVEASCHCGAVRFRVASAPTELKACNCSLCRRLGGLWAYYSPKDVVFEARDTAGYIQGDRSIESHHCRTCGCTTHWQALDPDYDRMGVNARLMDPAAIEGVRVRRFDGADTWEFLD